jgi:hypothetical protein
VKCDIEESGLHGAWNDDVRRCAEMAAYALHVRLNHDDGNAMTQVVSPTLPNSHADG